MDPFLGWVVIVLLVAAGGPCLFAVGRGRPGERG